MKKVLNLLFLMIISLLITSCSENDDCPDILEVNINDPESVRKAEACGLSPAQPLSASIWIYEI